MKCSEDNANCFDSSFIDSDSSSGSQSSPNSSSSDYVQTEEAETETEDERNCKSVSFRGPTNNKKTVPVRAESKKKALQKEAVDVIMDISVNNEDLLHPRSRKQKGALAIQRQTRGTSKLSLTKQGNEENGGEGSHSITARRKKDTTKAVGSVLGKKKGKSVSPTVVGAIFGNLKSCVADVAELRRKRDEDALKCARMPRTVANGSKTMSAPSTRVTHSEDRSMLKDLDLDIPQESTPFTRKSPEHELSEELQHTTNQGEMECTVLVKDPRNRSIHSEHPLQNTNVKFQPLMPAMKNSESSDMRTMLDTSKQKEKDLPAYSRRVDPILFATRKRRSPSPTMQYNNNRSRRSEIWRQASSPEIREGHRRWSYDSVPMSSRGLVPNRGDDSVSTRWTRNLSSSPTYDERGRQRSRDQDFNEQKSRSTPPLKMRSGTTYKAWEESEEHVRWRSRESSPTDNHYQCNRSLSPHQRHERKKKSPGFRTQRSTSPLSPRFGPHMGAFDDNALQIRMEEDVVTLPTSADRKTRRRNQSARESQKLQRLREGKKPFYLTVDREGRPYGPGRPAWIAEINKLAVGLDPSCTDIRKQAHGDICIFKKRLDEKFDYSRDLNEDYLRSFMGKAVTRKRTDLIDFINMNGSRPSHFDSDVWDRLEMLATSKQREKRTEHGRYANACRRTLGRTGALGEEGVRLHLRDVLRRSPDPEEVAEEMQRDKGFGKLKRETSRQSQLSRHELPDDALKIEDKKFQSLSTRLQRINSDGDHFGKQESEVNGSNQNSKRKKSSVDQISEKMNWIVQGSDLMCGSKGRHVTEKLSKDDYIARLEAELESIRGETMNKSFSGKQWSCQSGLSAGEYEEASQKLSVISG